MVTPGAAPMTDAERRRILVEWNDTARPYPADKCVHSMVELTAAENPDALAVEHEARRLGQDGELPG